MIVLAVNVCVTPTCVCYRLAVPGIDVVISGHSHTELTEPILVNGRTPVVQTGKESNNLGELVLSLDGATLAVESYRLPHSPHWCVTQSSGIRLENYVTFRDSKKLVT